MNVFIKTACVFAAMLVVAAATAADSFPGTTFYWVGGSGNWSEVSNWSTDKNGASPATRYPGSDATITNDVAYFTATANGTITLDVDVTIYRFVGESAASLDVNPLTFTGGSEVHSMKITSKNNGAADRSRFVTRKVFFENISYSGTYLEFRGEAHFGSGAKIRTKIYAWESSAHVYFEDGCEVTTTGHIQANGAKLTFNGGKVSGQYGSGSNNGTYYGGTMTFNGGEHSIELVARRNMTVNMTGGNLTLTGYSTDDTASITVTGGHIKWPSGVNLTDRRWLGDADTIFEVQGRDSYYAVNVITEDEPLLDFSGTLYMTNNVQYTAFAITNMAAVYGSGTMYLNRLYTDGTDPVSFGLHNLYIGKSLTFNSGGAFNFRDQYFGSFGNWGVGFRDSSGYIYLAGTNTFDTTDAFDGVTGRRITMSYAVPMQDSSIVVQGCGNLVWVPYDSARLKDVNVAAGATLSPSNGTLCADSVTLGENAKLRLVAGKSAVQPEVLSMADGASIEVVVPGGLSSYAYSAVDLSDVEADTSTVLPKISCIGDGAANYALRQDKGCVYLHNGAAYEVPETYRTKNFWTGASPAGNNTGDAANWYTNGVPPTGNNSTILYFGGYDNLTITNNMSRQWKSWIFLKDCGPVLVRGDTLQSASYAYFDKSGASFVSLSPFPVVIEAPVRCRANRISVIAGGDSYIEFASNVYCEAAWNFFVQGHVRVSGSVTGARSLFFGNTDTGARTTTLEVMPGGSVSITNQYEFSDTYHQLCNKLARFCVHGGGRVEFLSCKNAAGKELSKFGWTSNGKKIRNRVDGEFDVQCPLVGSTPMYFGGTGTLHVATTMTTNANASLILGGGIRFSSDAFRTATSEWPDNIINLAVEGGDATLVAERDWTYGPEEGLAVGTTADERALTVAYGSTLHIAAGAHKVSFADPIYGLGALAFDPGAQIGLAGELFRSAKTEWTTVATVHEVSGEPAVAGCKVQVQDLGNGLVALKAKLVAGLKVILR